MLCRKCARRLAATSRGLSTCVVCAGLVPKPELRPRDLLGVAPHPIPTAVDGFVAGLDHSRWSGAGDLRP